MTLLELTNLESFWHTEFRFRASAAQSATVVGLCLLALAFITGFWGFVQGWFVVLALACLWTYHAQRKANHYSILATYLKESLKDDH